MNQRLAVFRSTVQASLTRVSMMSREELAHHMEEDHGFGPQYGHVFPVRDHPDLRGWHQVLHEDYAFPHDHDPAELAHNPWDLEEWD